MDSLTVLGGRGFVLSEYIRQYHDPAIDYVRSINTRDDYEAHSKDILMGISTVHNFHVFDKPLLDIDTNLTTLVEVLESWRKRPDSKEGAFNFISSWLVYGNQERIPVSEDAVCKPSGFYSITKHCAEQLLIDYCRTFGLKYRILRLCNVIGPGDTKVSSQKNGLQYLVNKLKVGDPIEVYGDGNFFRSYIHVKDCARAIDLIITKGKTNETYNVGANHEWTFRNIIDYCCSNLKSTSSVTHVEPKEFQKQVVVKSFLMDVSKLNALGYAPEFTGEKLFRSICEH
jgi:nucleoside-diphosphate-sugar epimerase